MPNIRPPAVAGTFYPADPHSLRAAVRGYLKESEPADIVPKALIVPHAGYVYSGPVAGIGYARLAAGRAGIRRVVLAGPAHRAPVRGIAASSAEGFATPLGEVPIDREFLGGVLAEGKVYIDDDAHRPEHSLEVQLPFLQEVLDRFHLVPLLVGTAAAEQVADVLDALWDGPETVVLVSSDLSHYHTYEKATEMDRATCRAVERLEPEKIGPHQACGCRAIGGLLRVAAKRALKVTTLDLRNSGDTAGPRREVVGYGCWAFRGCFEVHPAKAYFRVLPREYRCLSSVHRCAEVFDFL